MPIEPIELAERERRRQIALAHQEAIREQLEERERKRKEERERLIKEEYEEELRIKKEKEIERLRKEKEEQIFKEKLEREKKRKEALQEAIEIAEKQARQERVKLKLGKQHDVNIKENLIEKDNTKSPRQILENHIKDKNAFKKEECGKVDIEMHTRLQNLMENEYIVNATYSNNKEIDNRNVIKNKNELTNINQTIKDDSNNNKQPHEDQGNPPKVPVPPLQLPSSNVRSDSLALVLQTPYETLQNMQFAVLMPTSNNGPPTALPIAVPLTIATDRSSPRTENRILTPSQFRSRRFCDSSTQTELSELNKHNNESNRDKYIRDKMSNLEISYDNRSRKEKRIRNNDDRNRENTDRPKWGVNRPPTRYLKQSEKDPVYQRRKLRQKLRQVKNYEHKTNNYSPHSSDESQTASPRVYRKNMYPEKRHERALWRKNDQMFAQNVRVYQTEIVPLETDKDHIYYKRKSCRQCCCRCRDEKDHHIKVVDILKIQHSSPTECISYGSESLKDQIPDSLNNNSMDDDESSVKQDHWEN